MEVRGPDERAAISVVVTTYNSAAHLAETLESVRMQTIPPAEVIIVDDGSTDASVAIAERFDVKVLRKANGGPSSARNVGIRAATQPWIAFLDGDDLWKPEKLARQWQAIRLASAARFAFSDWSTFDDAGLAESSFLRGRPIFERIERKKLAEGISLCALESLQLALVRHMLLKQSSLIIERNALLEAGLYDEGMRLFEDWDLMLRILARHTGVAVEESLVAYRRHATSLTWNLTALQLEREQLWTHVASDSAKYPPCAVSFATLGRRGRLRETAISAIRNGYVAEAERPLRESLREKPNFSTLLLFAGWYFIRHPAGHRMMEIARSAWRTRPLRSRGTK